MLRHSFARTALMLCALVLSACNAGGGGLPAAPAAPGGENSIESHTGAFSEFALPAGQQAPDAVAITASGSVYVSTPQAIDRVAQDGAIAVFPAPDGVTFQGGIAAASQNSIWVPAVHFDPLSGPEIRIYRLSSSGTFTFVTPPLSAQGPDIIPSSVTTTSSNTLVYVVQGTFACGAIGSVDTTTGATGGTSSFCEPTAVSGTKSLHRSQVAADSNGDLYVTEFDRFAPGGGFSAVLRINAQGTVLQTFTLPNAADPEGITVAKNHTVWVVLAGLNAIGRLSRSGALQTFPVPSAGAFQGFPSASASRIVSGPNGSLWFAEIGTNKIARVTQAGKITEFAVPTPGSGPSGIAACAQACNGATIWFAETIAHKIAGFRY